MDKDPTAAHEIIFVGTVINDVVQDGISAAHPYGALVAAPLLEAAGVLHVDPVLRVMPDAPALGDFRIEETLIALTDLVRAGKVRYIGCSNMEAWELMQALGVSERRGLEAFKCTQSYDSLVGRELEHQTIPLIQNQGLGLLVWSPLAGGFLSGQFTRDESPEGTRRATFEFPPVNKEQGFDIVDAMRPIGEAHDASVAQIALAWLLHKTAVTSVIIGAKRMYQLEDNLGSVDVSLSDDEVARLDEVSRIPLGYPAWMGTLGDDRLPGEMRDIAALARSAGEEEEGEEKEVAAGE